jgi:hypothetical protein
MNDTVKNFIKTYARKGGEAKRYMTPGMPDKSTEKHEG